MAAGSTNVDVTMKNISSRNMTSVIDAMENAAETWYWRFNDIGVLYMCVGDYSAGSLSRSINSMVRASSRSGHG